MSVSGIYSCVQRLLTLLFAGLFGFAAVSAQAANTDAHLVLADQVARPGDTVMVGFHLHMAPEWHTYWKNSGDSGIPTTIKWDLPQGVTAGEIQWPVPEKFPEAGLTTYIYRDDVVLLVPLKIAADMPPGSVQLKAKISWLECKTLCLPGSTNVEAVLNIGRETKLSPDAALIEAWQKKLPASGANLSAHAWWEKAATGDTRPLILEWNSPNAASEVDFYPYASEQFEIEAATERIPVDAPKIQLRKQVKKFEGDWPTNISGLLIQKSGTNLLAYEATLPVASSGTEIMGAAQTSQTVAPAGTNIPQVASVPSLWKMLFYAFIGGLILNVMPCVLPVIALKIVGFVGEARNDPRHVRKLGLIYALGVLFSFLVLALLVLVVKAAGHKASWGMQFGNPYFIVAMTVLVILIALNLFGVFEITLGGRTLSAASAWSSKHGAAGAFFNGLLATVLATSCTAPFLGAAAGFALVTNASYAVLIAIFLMVGVGLAAPYVILSWQPAWLKFLPKPGAWMEKFKVAMGFPMLAAGVWLFNLTFTFYADRTWWLAIFLVFVALAAWVYGEFVQRGRNRRGLALIVTAVLLATGYAYALEDQLRWREPLAATASSNSLAKDPSGIDWQRWSPEAVAQARAAGRPVLVDFTAKWCLTCQANKAIAIEIPSVEAKLKAINAVALLGDYTRFPDNITEELNRFGRAGVPLVLVYPKDASTEPIVLPEALTPGIVLDALDRAAR